MFAYRKALNIVIDTYILKVHENGCECLATEEPCNSYYYLPLQGNMRGYVGNELAGSGLLKSHSTNQQCSLISIATSVFPATVACWRVTQVWEQRTKAASRLMRPAADNCGDDHLPALMYVPVCTWRGVSQRHCGRMTLNGVGSISSIRDHVRYEFLTAVTMKNVVFWDIGTQSVLLRRHITSPLQSPAS
jgi:hypothetical protein